MTLPHDFENERTDKELVDQFGVRPDFVVDSPDAVPATWLDDGDVQLYCGDAVDVLRSLPAESIQTCVTSPPYWGLRDYGTGSWTGGDANCNHPHPKSGNIEKNLATSTLAGTGQSHAHNGAGSTCARCGARRVDAQLGLEPTPTEHVASLVAVFAEVWRVLRGDGTLWLNLGDSYAGSGPSGASYQSETTKRRAAGNGQDGAFRVSPTLGERGLTYRDKKPHEIPSGLKAKDLVGVPWRVAFALQEAGWYLRSDIIWAKPNPMPESVSDRPTKAHEYVFLLAKQPRYYYDADAIRESAIHEGRVVRATGAQSKNGQAPDSVNDRRTATGFTTHDTTVAGRNARSVWEIATQPTPEAHFATYPEALVRRCILAGSREGDLVLDPFVGSGTTALVARKHGRRAIGIDLSADYLAIAARRLGQQSLFATSEGAA